MLPSPNSPCGYWPMGSLTSLVGGSSGIGDPDPTQDHVVGGIRTVLMYHLDDSDQNSPPRDTSYPEELEERSPLLRRRWRRSVPTLARPQVSRGREASPRSSPAATTASVALRNGRLLPASLRLRGDLFAALLRRCRLMSRLHRSMATPFVLSVSFLSLHDFFFGIPHRRLGRRMNVMLSLLRKSLVWLITDRNQLLTEVLGCEASGVLSKQMTISSRFCCQHSLLEFCRIIIKFVGAFHVVRQNGGESNRDWHGNKNQAWTLFTTASCCCPARKKMFSNLKKIGCY